jgi:hypothetical protein
VTPDAGDEGPDLTEIAALQKAADEARLTARDFARLRGFIGVAGVVGLASTWAVWGVFSGTARGLLLLAGLALFFIAMLVFFAWSLTRAIADARRRAEELERRLRTLRDRGG